MHLVYKEDDAPRRAADFPQERFHAIFKLAAELCASNDRADIERNHLFPLQRLRHFAVHDFLRQAVNDSRFPDAGFADEDRIILCAARQYLHEAPQFVFSADNRVKLPLPRALGNVDRVFFQNLKLTLRRFVGYPRTAAQVFQRPHEFVAVYAAAFQNVLRPRGLFNETD